MPRVSLTEELADQLLEEIIEGRYPAGSALPSELELAKHAGVSRLTVREAIKTLGAKNVVEIRRGRGTYVNPPVKWTAIESVLRAARSSSGTQRTVGIPYKLLEARRIIEVNVAGLAAARRTDDDLAAMEKSQAAMEEAHRGRDVEAVVAADIAFHQAVLDAAGNPFISALFDSLAGQLVEARRQTSAHAEIREHAIEHHRNILAGIRASDPERARWAMHGHMSQTENDLGAYVFDRLPAKPDGPSDS